MFPRAIERWLRRSDEEFRKVASRLAQAHREKSRRAFVFSGDSARSGTTTVTLGVAVQLVLSYRLRVLVVELNRTRAVFARLLGLDRERGLADLARGQRLEGAMQRWGGLSVVCANPRLPGSGLGDPAQLLQRIIEEGNEAFDVVLFDCAPLLEEPDMPAFLSAVPSLIYVTRAGRTTGAGIARIRAFLDRMTGVEVVGVVLNRYKRYIPEWLDRLL